MEANLPKQLLRNLFLFAIVITLVYLNIDTKIADFNGVKTLANPINHKLEAPNNAKYDTNGNLIEYTIGPKHAESLVTVHYVTSTDPAIVSRLQITRPNDEELIVYERQLSDPTDSNSPYIYTETRNCLLGDLLFANFRADKDGRINIYFDFESKKLAISINPQTGEEEYR